MRGTSPLPCPRVNSRPRVEPNPPVAGDETATMLGSLERQRAIFAWKCGGLGGLTGQSASNEPPRRAG